MAWGTKWEHVECPVLTFMLIRRTLTCGAPLHPSLCTSPCPPPAPPPAPPPLHVMTHHNGVFEGGTALTCHSAGDTLVTALSPTRLVHWQRITILSAESGLGSRPSSFMAHFLNGPFLQWPTHIGR